MKAVQKFLKAHIGDSNIDTSTAIFDKWGGVKGIKAYSHCTLTLLNDANGSLGIGNIEVESGFRSSGIGRKTMKMLLDCLKDCPGGRWVRGTVERVPSLAAS